MSITITRTWLARSATTVLIMAVLGFLAALAAGGTSFNVSTVHAAVYAAWTAAATAIQTIAANLINPPAAQPATLVSSALRQRGETPA